jgi:hypothetical protein
MSSLAINGANVGGTVRELKDGVNLKEAIAAAKSDGLDQVFFEANNKNYVCTGEKLDLKGIKNGVVPVSDLRIDGKIFDVKIHEVDNEVNSASEGVGKLKWIATGEGAVLGGLSLKGLLTTNGGEQGLGEMLGGFVGLIGTAVVVGGTLGGAAIWGANRGTHPEQLEKYLK